MIINDSIEHTLVAGGRNLLCLWPRHGGLWRWGNEMLAGFVESPCAYHHPQEAARDLGGVWKRGYLRLRRSVDGGKTWQDDGRVFDHSLPVEKQRQILRLDEYRGHDVPDREAMALDSPDGILIMGHAWCGDEIRERRLRKSLPFCFRSTDRGRHWESAPSVLWPHHTGNLIEAANNTLNMGNGRFVCWLVGCDGMEGVDAVVRYHGPLLYLSEDHGAQWSFYGEICRDPEGRIAFAYPQIVPLPSGRWLCFVNAWHQNGSVRLSWTALCHSDDQGLTWSAPRRIHMWSFAPFPLRLSDGRIVLLYVRNAPDPTGLFAMISEDDGASWSRPQCLRNDALPAGPRSCMNDGFPVAVEMDGGRVFTAYCWQHEDEDVPWPGGRSFIGGTFFAVR